MLLLLFSLKTETHHLVLREINMEQNAKDNHLSKIALKFNKDHYRSIHQELTFDEYIDKLYENPKLARTAYQYIYDMIISQGYSTVEELRNKYNDYNFFSNSDIPIVGIKPTLHSLVEFFKGAAGGFGPEKRFLLLHGPVGSAKSTICRLLKKGLESYSITEEGSWYTFKWVNLTSDDDDDSIYIHDEDESPMRQDPLCLIPKDNGMREEVLKDINKIFLEQTPEELKESQYRLICNGDLDPRSKKFMSMLLKKYDGDWDQVIKNHIKVVRKTHNESDRVGIATFQPKDEKNQDSSELTGDIHWGKLPHFGSDSDPRAFEFDGEFCVGSRGMVEFIEVLKLAKEFLYDLLGASQEQSIKPKKFPQISVDTVLCGHSNSPEFEKLKQDVTMEALRDRTVKIDVPYLLKWSDELQVLNSYYGEGKVKQHIAPHTLEIAALWSVLTRYQDDKTGNVDLITKAKLYDGKNVHGYTQDSVKELIDASPEEGMSGGMSCRYTQDKISSCLSGRHDYINPFMVLNAIKKGIDNQSLINDKEAKKHYNKCVDVARKELDEILKKEVQRALVGDEDAIVRLCANYIDNISAYIDGVKVINPITEEEQDPDENLMRSIEEKIGIASTGVDQFRRSIAAFIGNLSMKKQEFTWKSNEGLKKALEKKLYEDTKNTINLSSLHKNASSVVDKNIQEKIDTIKLRLIEDYGYNEKSATDVLDYVSSIAARGDIDDDDNE